MSSQDLLYRVNRAMSRIGDPEPSHLYDAGYKQALLDVLAVSKKSDIAPPRDRLWAESEVSNQ